MFLIGQIKSFFNPEFLVEPAHTIRIEQYELSFEIISYVLGLASSKTFIQVKHKKYESLHDHGPTTPSSLFTLYSEIEDYLINDEPLRKFTREAIREKVRANLTVTEEGRGLSLLFVSPLQQQIKLALLILGEIYLRGSRTAGMIALEKTLHSAIAGTPLADMHIEPRGIYVDPIAPKLYSLPDEQLRLVVTDITAAFALLYRRLYELQGRDVTNKQFESSFEKVKKEYVPHIDIFPAIASMMPEGLLIDERLGFMTREMLEQKVREATRQLAEEKRSVQHKVLERTRELHNEQAKLRASINSLSAGFVIIDPGGKIVIRNSAANKIYGIDPEKDYEVNDLVELFKHEPEVIKKFQEVYKARSAYEFKNVTKGDLILRAYVAPIFGNEVKRTDFQGYVIMVEDITEERVLQRSRDEFFSIASHELRTPLTAIRGNASMALDIYKDTLKSEPDLKEMIVDVKQSSMRLIEIVNDFLDISRIEQDKINFTIAQFEIFETIEDVVHELHQIIEHKKIYLKFDELSLRRLPKVAADKDRAKQILYNLVGNAMKFTEKGGITISADVVANNHIKIYVSDTGRGISSENQKLLFHKFQQANDNILTRDTTKGTGLGLYISKILTDRMKGNLALENSVPGEGSVFSFSLPVAKKQSVTKKAKLAKADA